MSSSIFLVGGVGVGGVGGVGVVAQQPYIIGSCFFFVFFCFFFRFLGAGSLTGPEYLMSIYRIRKL